MHREKLYHLLCYGKVYKIQNISFKITYKQPAQSSVRLNQEGWKEKLTNKNAN